MGCSMWQIEANFFIPAENKNAALTALHLLEDEWASARTLTYGGVQVASKHLFLEDQLSEYGWFARCDKQGNINALIFDGEYLGDEKKWLAAIAPYVRQGSYLGMNSDERGAWMWHFDGTAMHEYAGVIMYPECPDDTLSGKLRFQPQP